MRPKLVQKSARGDLVARTCEDLAGEIQRRGANRRGGHSRDSANLVDNFTNNGEVFSDASEVLEAQIASMDFGKGKCYLDGGATKHVTPNKRVFEKLEVVEGSSIQTAGGQSLSVKGKGPVSANGIKFGEVLYVPGLTKSLLSVGSIADDGYKLLFDSGQMHILKDFDLADTSCIVASGRRDNHNDLYLLGSPQAQSV